MNLLGVDLTQTQARGIFQSDIIFRSALDEALKRLRANPDELRYVFASLAQDELTSSLYGEKEIEKARSWFLRHDIPVFMVPRLDDPKAPAITFWLTESVEAEQTHGDVHYIPFESTEADWPVLAGPMTPSYNPATGTVTMVAEALDGLILVPGMLLVDGVGNTYPILEVLDEDNQVRIQAGTMADFRGMTIKGAQPKNVTALESMSFRETYQVGCHAKGEPTYLVYLHAIVVYILLRFKQELLEARGFERSSIGSTQFQRNQAFDQENVFSRYINVTGYVRQYWPKSTSERIQSVQSDESVSSVGVGDAEADSLFGTTA